MREMIFDIDSRKAIKLTLIGLCVLAAIYHFVNVFVFFQGSTEFYVTHVGLLTVIALVGYMHDNPDRKLRLRVALSCILLFIPSVIYMYLNSYRLEGVIQYINNLDFAIGVILMVVILVVLWLLWGPPIPIITTVLIAYYLWGHLLPGALYHPFSPPTYVISTLATSLSKGIFGGLAPISANMIFYFMLFSGVITAMGVMPAFMEIGKIIARRLRGGPAYMAWAGSSLVGMISGSGAANVVITGTFTIPAMKDAGFTPEEAGAIEAVCSSGGQITPPVMASTAFVMAAFIGVPYVFIMKGAVLGAILFYLSVFIAILFSCHAAKRKRYVGEVNYKTIARRFPVFLTGLIIIVFLLLQMYSVKLSATMAILGTLLMGLLLVPETRSLKKIIHAFVGGAKMGAEIGIIIFAVGMLADAIISTGLGPKVAQVVVSMAGGMVVPSLLLIAAMSLILTMGAPILVAYLLIAILILPSLWSLGVDLVASHFFAFYFAFLGLLTPPVAVSALVASRLAGGNFWRTSFWALRIAAIMFLFPFAIVLHPTLLDFPLYGLDELMIIGALFLATVGIAATQYNWFLTKLNIYMRVLAASGTLAIVIFILELGNLTLLLAGATLMAIVIFIQVATFMKERSSSAPSRRISD